MPQNPISHLNTPDQSNKSTDSNTSDYNLSCVILCAGSGTRLANSLTTQTPKQFLKVGGHPLFFYSLRTFLAIYDKWQQIHDHNNVSNPDQSIDQFNYFKSIKQINIYLVTQPCHQDILKTMVQASLKQNLPKYLHILPTGGDTRQESVLNTLNFLQNIDLGIQAMQNWIMIHDSARPYLHINDLEKIFMCFDQINSSNHNLVRAFQGAILAKKVYDTVKMLDFAENSLEADAGYNHLKTLNRDHLFFAQTPQLFNQMMLKNALTYAKQQQKNITDEAQAVEFYHQECLKKSHHIQIIESAYANDKITVIEDWQRFQSNLNQLIF
jgi:2-C-methyl-D-erythritol 4-phosphate cytidylyltransferase